MSLNPCHKQINKSKEIYLNIKPKLSRPKLKESLNFIKSVLNKSVDGIQRSPVNKKMRRSKLLNRSNVIEAGERIEGTQVSILRDQKRGLGIVFPLKKMRRIQLNLSVRRSVNSLVSAMKRRFRVM